jgi:hypothetical protein
MAEADTLARAASQGPAPEARPIASMLEQALANGVRVIPVSSAAASPLDGHDGVAALLRW